MKVGYKNDGLIHETVRKSEISTYNNVEEE